MVCKVKTLISILFFLWENANSADPAKKPQNESSDPGSPMFGYRMIYYIKFEKKMEKNNTNNPSNGNGQVQLIRVGNFISHNRVKE